MTHSMDIRVYYEDTDAGGVVYYTNYLKFAERARTELLRGFGVEQADLRDKEKVLFVVRHIVADYLNSARLDDLLEITTHVKTLKNASVVFVQEITRKETGGRSFYGGCDGCVC